MRFLNVALFAALSPLASASLQVVPGGTWTASNGEHLQAHGAGVIQVDDLYYLIGEDKTNGSAFQNVNCYSSPDLVQWTYVGALLSRTSSGDLGPNRVVERPKVLYNASTKKYVLYMHIDSSSYGEAKVGVATGDTVCGSYDYLGSFQPLGFQSRDMGLFQDDDGTGYLLSEDRANGLRIDKLSDDYLSVEESTYLWSDSIEAPALLKQNGRYYMFGSHLTGWDPNDNVYSTSTSLTSGWSAWATFATVGSNTYSSQTNFILPVGPSAAVYLGDRWVSSNLMASTYVWLPLSISGTSVTMPDASSWVPNLNTTTTSASLALPSQNAYEGEAATYGGAAHDVSCGACSGGTAAGYVGGPDDGTVTFTGVTSDVATWTTVQVRYVNGDSTPRYANVRVNGGAAVKLAFLPTGSSVSSSTLNVDLEAGSDNEILFEAVGTGWGPDIDRLLVPVS
ncbi:carbohydrate-binding module family 35 protein [Annulohypoxylon truncatum]|uniref:carbohydrate-binding module family 35 protein n=1 Tax=Annulohypoxylon truncatum TaxID=327061 RepID=UPI002008E713|nr:carbohydrate-binding module family 35 protein [Annulohypoxylon truncatum]KAI1207603.1 carbohydrate-binding module family 35 protein [Annulohypoxylon truncatum]